VFQIPAGDPGALLFARQPDANIEWKVWFGAWGHIRTLAFVCEDIWWHRSSETSKSEASKGAEKIVRQWLANSSLETFEVWSGIDSIQLSSQLRIQYGRFHNIHDAESTRHRYSFRRDENTRTWMLSPPTIPMRSAISNFREHICVDRCWICLSMEEDEDLETVISYLDDVRQEDRHDRISEQRQWSKLDDDPSYNLLM